MKQTSKHEELLYNTHMEKMKLYQKYFFHMSGLSAFIENHAYDVRKNGSDFS